MTTTTGHLFRRSTTQLPRVVRADGVWIETADGRRFLDGSAGALVASIGHGVRSVVGAAGGALVPPPEYFPIIRQICDRYGVLFIADEVMTGIGRTGRNFAVDHWGVVPDVITTGKGVSGGYAPLAAMIVREPHYQSIAHGSGAFVHGFTYGAHPPSCAAGAAVLDYVEAHDLVARAAAMGERLMERLDPLREHPIVGDLRGLGLMIGVELV